jgi:FAD/FMN-containing dehydrogenase
MRVSGFNLVIISQWTDASASDRNIAWCRDTYAAMQPHFQPTRYMNYMEADEAADLAAVAYGPNYARLRELKSKYDPDNFFHTNVNIRPR